MDQECFVPRFRVNRTVEPHEMAENDLRIQSHIDGQEVPGAEQPPGQPMDGGQDRATDIEDGGPENVDAPDTRSVGGDEWMSPMAFPTRGRHSLAVRTGTSL